MNIQPTRTELKEANEIVEQAIKKASTTLEIKTNPKIALGYTHDNFTIDTLGGVSGETFNDEKIDINFNSEPHSWKDNLRRTSAHEYAHTQFFQTNPRRRNDPLWKVILGEAQSTNLAEKCFPEAKPPTIKAADNKQLEKYWPQVRDRMSEEMGWNNEILFSDFYNYDLPMYYGYSLAFQIGQKLLEKHKLKDFPDLKEEDVIEAGDKILRNEIIGYSSRQFPRLLSV